RRRRLDAPGLVYKFGHMASILEGQKAWTTPSAPRARVPERPVSRELAVDVVRGGVMVLMALDHVRDYVTNLRFPPENLARGTAALFATRWVTHFCAPAFFLLAGVGIGISMSRGRSAAQMSRFLVTRGLWLVVLDLTIS